MNEDNTIKDIIKKNLLTIIVLVGTICVAYFNLSTAAKLAPIAERLTIVESATAHIKENLEMHITDSNALETTQFAAINARLDRIQNLLNQIILEK